MSRCTTPVQGIIVAALVVSFVCMAPLSAAPSVKVTLPQAVKWAVQRRGDVKAAKLGVDVKKGQKTRVNAKFFPVITGNASANIGLAGSFAGLDLIGLSMSPYKELIGGSVDAVWEVLDFGKTVAQSSAAGHEVDAATHSAADVERLVRYKTADLYLRCLAARHAADLAHKHHKTAALGAKVASAHRKAELISKADEELAQLAALQAHRHLLTAQQLTQSCRLNLGAYIGAKGDIELVDVQTSAAAPAATQAKLLAAAARRRPDLMALNERVKASASRVKAAALDHLPKIRAVGSVGWSLVNERVAKVLMGTDFNHSFYAVGVGIQVPIFEGGAIHARMKMHQARRDAQQARLADLRRKVKAE
ncbi:MAG TPA: hypothetical protein DCQ06_00840, partial [Myxococcales bacterium]|nr:hypothetical protein [Myxococcales bacterium]